jgi:hypothetical protein
MGNGREQNIRGASRTSRTSEVSSRGVTAAAAGV